MNEAAIAAARLGKSTVGWEEMDGAVDRIMVGLEKKRGKLSRIYLLSTSLKTPDGSKRVGGTLLRHYAFVLPWEASEFRGMEAGKQTGTPSLNLRKREILFLKDAF